jgi:A/G-specific adenine glycosylase
MSAEVPVAQESASPIAEALLTWHARHGRHDLPWQQDRTPYRVWVSEIMLQQTQVATVIPYYLRFMKRFPDVRTLAGAPLDDVLHLWSGLGYYSRARNLHRAAALICDEHGGELPTRFDELAALPGIGRSTAGAILALSTGARWPILDGNVRRVLSRYFGVGGNASAPATQLRLWELAAYCTPHARVGIYTQAIMDLGATICTRHRPLCAFCPVAEQCIARLTNRQQELPAPRTARARRVRTVWMLLLVQDDGSVLLERRPESGVWGGLWCPPVFDSAAALFEHIERSQGTVQAQPEPLAPLTHAFTHFDMVMTPFSVRWQSPGAVMDAAGTLWYNIRHPARIGLPAPIKTLLAQLSRGVPDAVRERTDAGQS